VPFPGDYSSKFAKPRLNGLKDCILQPSPSVLFLFATRAVPATPGSFATPSQEFWHEPCCKSWVNAMKDLLFTIITIGFFAGAWLYTKACEKL
jgi:hypothetical protein